MKLRASYPYYLGGEALAPNQSLEVTDKYSGEVVTRVATADTPTVERAISLAAAAAEPMRRLAAYERQAILDQAIAALAAREDELALTLCIEAGKPIRDARGEVDRLLDTFKVAAAAAEAVRIGGEVMPLDITARARGYTGMWKRVPIGPCAFISPFNFPLNLVAHKVAPAIAAGCPFVLKPASLTPVGALLIGEVLAATDLPNGAFSILPCARADALPLATDERLKLLSFTGSPAAGWPLKARAAKKKVVLELGGNAAVIVDTDCDLADAVERIVYGAFYQSGQSCIGVQRILIHASIYERCRDLLCEATRPLQAGDPKRADTFIGPMISTAAAERLHGWTAAAVEAGAKLLIGGGRQGATLEPTLLEDVPEDQPVVCEEAFGPVAVLSRFTDFEEALAQVNRSRYGLQAGVFTRDLYKAQRAWDTLEVGGVVIGDVPSWRVDHMPYGGVKDSGLGREGVRFAIESMTEIRLLVIRTAGA